MDDPRKQGPQQGPIDWSEFIKQAQQSGAGADFNKIKSRFSHLKKRTIIIAAVVLVLVLALAYWWFHPANSVNLEEFLRMRSKASICGASSSLFWRLSRSCCSCSARSTKQAWANARKALRR